MSFQIFRWRKGALVLNSSPLGSLEKACIVSEIINELPKDRRVRSFLKSF